MWGWILLAIVIAAAVFLTTYKVEDDFTCYQIGITLLKLVRRLGSRSPLAAPVCACRGVTHRGHTETETAAERHGARGQGAVALDLKVILTPPVYFLCAFPYNI